MCKETDTLEILENINKIETLECKQLHTGNQYLEETCGMPALNYDYVLSQKGKNLLLIGGYTFSNIRNTENWRCSKKRPKCDARLKMDSHGKVIFVIETHSHPAEITHSVEHRRNLRARK